MNEIILEKVRASCSSICARINTPFEFYTHNRPVRQTNTLSLLANTSVSLLLTFSLINGIYPQSQVKLKWQRVLSPSKLHSIFTRASRCFSPSSVARDVVSTKATLWVGVVKWNYPKSRIPSGCCSNKKIDKCIKIQVYITYHVTK